MQQTDILAFGREYYFDPSAISKMTANAVTPMPPSQMI